MHIIYIDTLSVFLFFFFFAFSTVFFFVCQYQYHFFLSKSRKDAERVYFFSQLLTISNRNWTEWSAIQGLIAGVIREKARTLLYIKRLGYFLSV